MAPVFGYGTDFAFRCRKRFSLLLRQKAKAQDFLRQGAASWNRSPLDNYRLRALRIHSVLRLYHQSLEHCLSGGRLPGCLVRIISRPLSLPVHHAFLQSSGPESNFPPSPEKSFAMPGGGKYNSLADYFENRKLYYS